MLVPTLKIHLPRPHLHARWAASTGQADGELGHLADAFRTVSQAIGWGILIVFGVSMMVAFGFALVHVMNFWSLPGAP